MQSQFGVALPTQKILVKTKRGQFEGQCAFDTLSTMTLITHHFANKIGAVSQKVTGIQITAVGNTKTDSPTTKYTFSIVDEKNKPHNITAYGMKTITSRLQKVYLNKEEYMAVSKQIGKEATPKLLQNSGGNIDILLGSDYSELQCTKGPILNKLVLSKSPLKSLQTNWVLSGQLQTAGFNKRNLCNLTTHPSSCKEVTVQDIKRDEDVHTQ